MSWVLMLRICSVLGCTGGEMETKYFDYYSCSTAGYIKVSEMWNDLTEKFGVKIINEYGYMVSFYCDKREKNIQGVVWH